MSTTFDYLDVAKHEFQRLKTLAEGALAQVSDAQFFAIPGAGDNSLAVIVKHVNGNLISRWSDFLNSDGEKPWRDRDSEFVVTPDDSREKLMLRWEQGWAVLFAALEPLAAPDLERTVAIRGERLTVLQAVSRQLTHYAYHVGQIVFLVKHHCGPAWRTLSIPLGGSAAFNRDPASYAGSAQNTPPEVRGLDGTMRLGT